MTLIDLRSDTVTLPCPAMRRAIAEAEVGDDVYGEDPTVRRLQDLAAERMGHEAALFVPTGCMGNQIAIALHSRPGSSAVFLQIQKAIVLILPFCKSYLTATSSEK